MKKSTIHNTPALQVGSEGWQTHWKRLRVYPSVLSRRLHNHSVVDSVLGCSLQRSSCQPKAIHFFTLVMFWKISLITFNCWGSPIHFDLCSQRERSCRAGTNGTRKYCNFVLWRRQALRSNYSRMRIINKKIPTELHYTLLFVGFMAIKMVDFSV